MRKDYWLFNIIIHICVIFIVNKIIVVNANAFDKQLGHIKPKVSNLVQLEAINGLFERILGNRSKEFYAEIDESLSESNLDTYNINVRNGKIQITGTNAIAIASGFHYYLKYYCNCHISWEMWDIHLPAILPDVNFTNTANDRFRYYQNACTASYSFVWWDWKTWEKHIDWIVMNSYNLVLAFNGQEAIWQKVYLGLNLTQQEIDEHFAGPAFLSWSRMGNIRGWGGPLSKNWHNSQVELQRQIVNRMRQFGVTTILPAFAGHVPRAFKRLYPDVKTYQMQPWNNFNDTYCCPYLLDPTEPLFNEIGKLFIEELISEFGTDHVYNCDTFNEMQPFTNNITYLDSIGKAIYASMTDVDPQAIWVMQNWLFHHELIYWDLKHAEALLTSVPQGKMIILDLQSEQFPQYGRLKSYFGQPYIWCMLHNFGGKLGLFGSLDIINKRVFEARIEPNSTLIGTGITPEGINQNYVVYDLMSEMAWRKSPTNLTDWIQLYATRRYGKEVNATTDAWRLLKDSVYNYNGLTKMRGNYAINRMPSTKIKTWSWYNICDLLEAWDLLLEAAEDVKTSPGYQYDLVDVTRQVLQVLGDQYYNEMIVAFKQKDTLGFQQASIDFLSLFPDLEKILASNEGFLLGTWLESAKNLALDEKDKQLFEYNARNQITLWGPNGEIKNYASKQWSGVVSDFFEPQWTLFIAYMNQSLVRHVPFKESRVTSAVFRQVSEPFTFERKLYPTEPKGNSVEIARKIHEKWLASGHYREERSRKYNTIDKNIKVTQIL